MDFLVIISETIAFAALILFSGILDSKYYESKKIRHLTRFIWLPAIILLVILYPDAPIQDSDKLGCPWLHIVYDLLMIGLLVYAYKKFSQLRFNYSRQYLFARGALYWSVIFIVIAIGALIASFFI